MTQVKTRDEIALIKSNIEAKREDYKRIAKNKGFSAQVPRLHTQKINYNSFENEIKELLKQLDIYLIERNESYYYTSSNIDLIRKDIESIFGSRSKIEYGYHESDKSYHSKLYKSIILQEGNDWYPFRVEIIRAYNSNYVYRVCIHKRSEMYMITLKRQNAQLFKSIENIMNKAKIEKYEVEA